jgi:alginate O-acetyltransferase complex protein AlgI
VLFNSLTFVIFFIVVLVLYNLPRSWRTRKAILLVASYLFYAAWNPPLVLLLWLSTLIDWFCGMAIHRTPDGKRRRLLLMTSLFTNFGLLAYFKYGEFVLQNFTVMMNSMGTPYEPAPWSIVLPVGISFYTFQTVTYTFDIYRRQLAPVRSFLDFSLYVTFFPQLVAGPIVRASQFLPQCVEPKRVTMDQMSWGLLLLTLGLFQKVVIADALLSKVSDDVFGSDLPLATLDAWIGVLAFSGQIFSDFAGYSTCAIGSALCLGFLIPNNFRFPYAAIGFSDFWQRWHITLSSWLRDYLYIPLGGNRRGIVRTYINLMLTMLIGGLWHGAAWTFVVWGGLHGVYLIGERLLRTSIGHWRIFQTGLAEIFLILFTNFLVCITWVFFRARSFEDAWRILRSLFGFVSEGAMILTTSSVVIVLVVYGAIVFAHWILRHATHEAMVEDTPWWLVSILWALMIVGIILAQGGGNEFIYFQF